jgi:hypothetical protein
MAIKNTTTDKQKKTKQKKTTILNEINDGN